MLFRGDGLNSLCLDLEVAGFFLHPKKAKYSYKSRDKLEMSTDYRRGFQYTAKFCISLTT